MKDSFLFAIRHIKRRRLRALLTAAGIAVGVLSVVIVSVIGEVGKTAVNRELDSMGFGGLCISAGEGAKAFSAELLKAVEESEFVTEVTPLLTKMTALRIRKAETGAVLWGVGDNAASIVSMELLHGRMISRGDVRRGAAVCIVDESFAKEQYKRTNIVGKIVAVNTPLGEQELKIIGVVRSGGAVLQGLMGGVVPSFLYVPYTAVTKMNAGQEITQILVKLCEGADEEEAAAAVMKTLGKGGYTAQNLNQQKEQLNGVLGIVTLILSALGGISLLVAGLSVMTVMLVTVHERTREIGIKKAIGATKRTILFEFLAEAVLLSLAGGAAGLLGGVLCGLLGCLLLGLPFAADIGALLFALFFPVLIGVIFGAYPAAKAAKVSPAQSLRSEN